MAKILGIIIRGEDDIYKLTCNGEWFRLEREIYKHLETGVFFNQWKLMDEMNIPEDVLKKGMEVF